MAIDNKTAPTDFEIFIESCRNAGIVLDDANSQKLYRRFTQVVKKGVISVYGEGAPITFENAWSVENIRLELMDTYDEFKNYYNNERAKKAEEKKTETSDVNYVKSNDADTKPSAPPAQDKDNVPEQKDAVANAGIVKDKLPKAAVEPVSVPEVPNSNKPEKKSKEKDKAKEPSGSESLLNMIPGFATKKPVDSAYGSRREVSLAISRLKVKRDIVQRPGDTISFEGYSYHIMKAITDCYSDNKELYNGKELKGIKEVVSEAVMLLVSEMEKSGNDKYIEYIRKELTEYNKKRAEFDAQIAELEKIRDNM